MPTETHIIAITKMKKLRFELAYLAIARSAKEAEDRGCEMLSTNQWWSIGQDDNGYFLFVPESDVDGLSAEELTRLE